MPLKTKPAQRAAALPLYRNASQSIAKRVEDLLRRMTLREKVAQLSCYSGSTDRDKIARKDGRGGVSGLLGHLRAPEAAAAYNQAQQAIVESQRLGIPVLWHDEGIAGLKAFGSTCFPQPIAQAATWAPDLIGRMAAVIAEETHCRGIRQILSPTINVVRDGRWGRTHETFGEDPYLTSRMAVAFIRALESRGIITTPKHFVANEGEAGHNSAAVSYGERKLRDVYFPPFQAAVQEAGASSLMCAYNSIDGVPCSASKWLLTAVLRGEWGFEGFVTSDYCSLEQMVTMQHVPASLEQAAQWAMEAGVDLETPAACVYDQPLLRAIKQGLVSQPTLDRAVRRVLAAKFKAGLFDAPWADADRAKAITDCAEHRALAREVCRQSIVLLRNKGETLPLKQDVKSIAVLGPLGDRVLLGAYASSGAPCVSLVEALRARLPEATVRFERGVRLAGVPLPAVPPSYLCPPKRDSLQGLRAEYFNNPTLSGPPAVTRLDPCVDFHWAAGTPDPAITTKRFSVRWTGTLRSPGSGLYRIGASCNDGIRLYIDGTLILDDWDNSLVRITTAEFKFQAGRTYEIKLEHYNETDYAAAGLVWDLDPGAGVSAAAELAKHSDAAIICVGAMDGECHDRADLELAAEQEALIAAVAATGTPTVVVLQTGNVIAMGNWIEAPAAILHAWYPGEECGNAIADVLLGEVNPGGKLPITFPAKTSQVPLYYNPLPSGCPVTDYVNCTGKPLFPFGFGLSYTTFTYSGLSLSKTRIRQGESVTVSFTLRNTGSRQGDEVVQLYLRDVVSSVAQPIKSLKRFRRVTVGTGQTVDVRFDLAPADLAIYDLRMRRVVEPGDFEIMIGSSSEDIRLRSRLTVLPASRKPPASSRGRAKLSGKVTRRN